MNSFNEGLYAIIVTPFDENGGVNEQGLRDNIDWYIELGVAGIICTGSTGSFDSLTDRELKRVIEVTADQVDGRVTAIGGTASTNTSKCVEYSEYAESVGMDGVMIVPPFYSLPTDQELYDHFETVAEKIGIPMIIYNNPKRAGVDLTPEWLANIAGNVENITHVKDSSGDVRRVHQIKELAGDNLTVFTGNDDLSFHAMLAGAKGWVAATSNIVPEHELELVQSIMEGDVDKSRKTFYQLLPLLNFISGTGKLVQVAKAGLDMRGKAGGPTRPPRFPLKPEDRKQLRVLLEDLGVL